MIHIPYKLNIICPHDGWILEKMGRELNQELSGSRLLFSDDPNTYSIGGPLDEESHINYYINYVNFRRKTRNIDAAWFTHIEEDPQNKPFADHFLQAAQVADLAIFNAPRYQRICKDLSKNAVTIVPGIDEQFRPTLNLGVVGRDYNYTSRKNPEMAEKLAKLDWLKIEYTRGEIPENELPNFYNRQDYTLVLSKVEGGPMCVLESLAMGREVIFPRDVGFGELFHEGLHMYEDNADSLLPLLERLYLKKKTLYNIVSKHTWKNFAEEHHRAFQLLQSRPL